MSDSPSPSESQPASGATSKTVVVGEIVGPFGHRGEVKVYPHTDFPERLTEMKSVTLRKPDGGERDVAVRGARFHKNVVLMQLDGVADMNAADALRGAELVIAPDERIALPDDSYYVDDLVGLRVVTDDGREVGTIEEVLRYPANDVYDLGNGLLIPAIGDVVLDVDLDAGVMTIHPIPGLLDEPDVA